MSSDHPAPTEPSAASPQQSGFLKRFVFGLLAMIAIFVGLSKAYHGLATIFGWSSDPVLTKLLAECEATATKALQETKLGDAEFNKLVETLNGASWASLRDSNATDSAAKHLQAASEQFRLAASKTDEALKRDIEAKWKEYFTLRRDMFAALADAYAQRKAAVDLMADPSIATQGELTVKLTEISAKADASMTTANALVEKSEKIAKENMAKAKEKE